MKAGYIHTWMGYDYRREMTEGVWSTMTRSRSLVNTVYGNAEVNWWPHRRWLFTAAVTANHHDVRSEDSKMQTSGSAIPVGYRKSRAEISGAVTARWQPLDGLGISAVIRDELYGDRMTPVIPALFADWKAVNTYGGDILYGLTLKASTSRNYRYPSLNDLYFMPGGNPDLRSENGLTYDCGADFSMTRGRLFDIRLSATWFDSHIDDWIIWLPTIKGFFSPRNVKSVHAYGVELKGDATFSPWKDWNFDVNGSFSWTPSVNTGDKMTEADRSVGKQLPYIPRYSASATARAAWKSWAILYKWCLYSERFTMTSNDYTLTGNLPAYSISNITLEKNLSLKPVDLQFKLAVNNLFDEDYLSVLSRPMPGINFEFFISITPKF